MVLATITERLVALPSARVFSYFSGFLRKYIHSERLTYEKLFSDSRSRRGDMTTLAAARNKISHASGFTPSNEELAVRLNWGIDRVRGTVGALRTPVSLQSPEGWKLIQREGKYNPWARIAPRSNGSETLYEKQKRALVQQALEVLTERERRVINLLFGLTDDTPRSMGAVGRIMGVTRERIRQLKVRALKKIRRSPGTYLILEPLYDED